MPSETSHYFTASELAGLIRSLDTEDAPLRRRVSEQILAQGMAALPLLVESLSAGVPNVRKSAAYLLGSYRGVGAASDALYRALGDEEPKVRQNAVVSLGKIGDESALDSLFQLLEQETVGYVRPSILLALGAIGGERVGQVLRALAPTDEREADALRKALDRCALRRQTVEWKPDGAKELEFYVNVPLGLDAVSLAEAREHSLPDPISQGVGWRGYGPGLPPDAFLPRLRCIEGLSLQIVLGDALSLTQPERLDAEVERLISNSPLIQHWDRWLNAEEEVIHYRFSLLNRVDKATFRHVLKAVQNALRPVGWSDSPSNYDVELTLHTEQEEGSIIHLLPSFMPDGRFAYRLRDVGASIHPVVGACLARLAKTPSPGKEHLVFDPTCGSGTLLIERAKLDNTARLIGLDVSRTAVSAAMENVHASGLSRRIQIRQGDAGDLQQWPDCDEVLANLPFGFRTNRSDVNLDALYGGLVRHLAQKLRPGGRAVLYTANQQLMEACLRQQAKRLAVKDRLHIETGGLKPYLWVLEPIP